MSEEGVEKGRHTGSWSGFLCRPNGSHGWSANEKSIKQEHEACSPLSPSLFALLFPPGTA